MKNIIANILACVTLGVSSLVQAVSVQGVDIPNAVSHYEKDGIEFVVVNSLCILRELVVANSALVIVVESGKIVNKGCIVVTKDKILLVFEGEQFKLTTYEIDPTKWVKYEKETKKYSF